MPQLTELRLSVGLTINTGNYESLRVDSTRAVKLAEGEDVVEARAILIDALDSDLRALRLQFEGR